MTPTPLPADALAWTERLKARGIETISPASSASFEDEWYDIATPDHFWLEWRLKVLLDLLEDRGVPLTAPLRVLDVGGGMGVFRTQLEKVTNWTVDLAELNGMALDRSEPGRGRTLYYDILEENPALIGTYDIVFVFDVVEHLPEPIPFLKASLAHLKPGGLFLVNVPALEWCRSAFDTVVGHLRRYDNALMAKEIAGLPLSDVETRYWGLSLVPILLLRKQLLRSKTDRREILEAGFKPPSDLVSSGLKALLRIETSMTKHPPVGSSLMMFARKH